MLCLIAYVEPGITVTDNSGEILTPVITGAVDINVKGSYIITYTATDSSNNTSSKTRTVNVIDTIAPVMSLLGANPLAVGIKTTYVEPGVTVTDNSGEILIPVISGAVNMNVKGAYILTYTATDSSNNTSSITRTVNVIDIIAPVITLIGTNPLNLGIRNTYIEPGVTILDNSGEVLTPVITGIVNVNVKGTC